MVSDAVLGTVVSVGLSRVCIDRIVADPAFQLTREEIQAVLTPIHFVGRSVHQVEEFIADYVQPIRDANKDVLNEKAQLSV